MNYEAPVITIVCVETQDVVRTSPAVVSDWNNTWKQPTNPWGGF